MPYLTTITNRKICENKGAARGIMPKTILQNTKYQGDIIWYEVFTYYGRISGKIGKVSRFYAAEDDCQDGVALFE